ncbi:MAG: cytochrome c biogenesis protein ResB [Cyanobacteria bacterium]|nr:cytochrome c biogenesis protein ResB [Cyanobacteriota bacterium]
MTAAPSTSAWRRLQRWIGWLADLRLAISLLLVIAFASGIGTAIPQKESELFYHQRYDPAPWLGLVNGEGVLRLQLDHVYSSSWFLGLLAWLGLALVLCSWRRQWPALQASLRWIDYRSPRQLSKLSVAETLICEEPGPCLDRLEQELQAGGWQIKRQPDRLAARRGVMGRVGPLLVHAGLVVLMVGAAWGAVAGQRLERFLAPGRELELLDSRGHTQLTLALDDFQIQRDPAGRPEQFSSNLRLIPPPLAPATSGSGGSADASSTPQTRLPDSPDSAATPAAVSNGTGVSSTAESAALERPTTDRREPSGATAPAEAVARSNSKELLEEPLQAVISVNHPLRYRGMTLYQADWALAAVNIQLGRSPVLQLPLQTYPELGEQVWGLVLPTRPDGSEPVFLSLRSEQGPVEVFGPDGQQLARIQPGGEAVEVRGLPIRVASVLPASGILLKRDPGVPLVYSGFAIALLGGGLSLVATRQLWAISEAEAGRLHVAGLCNRNLTAFAAELPALLGRVSAAKAQQG